MLFSVIVLLNSIQIDCVSDVSLFCYCFVEFIKIDCVLETSIACSERKRKMQDEQLETPSPKQICRHRLSNHVKFANKGESDPESTNSNSFDSSSSYSFMTNDDEDKIACGFQETRTCDEAFTSVDGFSSQNRLSINTSTRGQESLSINENQDPYAGIGFYTDEYLENLLYSNGVGPSSGFVLSSGRWAINQGNLT